MTDYDMAEETGVSLNLSDCSNSDIDHEESSRIRTSSKAEVPIVDLLADAYDEVESMARAPGPNMATNRDINLDSSSTFTRTDPDVMINNVNVDRDSMAIVRLSR